MNFKIFDLNNCENIMIYEINKKENKISKYKSLSSFSKILKSHLLIIKIDENLSASLHQ